MPKKVEKRRPVDRAAEYIDSPLMDQRLLYGGVLSVRIAGNYGTYKTQFRIGSEDNGACSCPSEEFPCKHIRALKATWERNPGSFFNLKEFLLLLSKKTKPELLELIGEMALIAPATLSALGIEGFEPDDGEDGGEENFADDRY